MMKIVKSHTSWLVRANEIKTDGSGNLAYLYSDIINNDVVLASSYELTTSITDTEIRATLEQLNEVDLPVSAADVLQQNLLNAGFSENDATFITYLEQYFEAGSDNALLNEFKASKSNRESLNDFLEKLYGDQGNTNIAAIDSARSAVLSLIDARNAGNLGVNTGDELQTKGLWLQALHDKSVQDSDSGKNLSGYNAKTNGFTLGYDQYFGDGLTGGVAFSHGQSDIKSQSNDTKTDSKSYIATVYGTRQLDGMFLEGSFSYGQAKNDSTRLNKTTKASYDSSLYNFRGIAGLDFLYGEHDLLIQPVIGINYASLNVDGYTETGSVAAKTVSSVDVNTLELGAGIRMNMSFEVGSGVLVPNAQLMAWHDTEDDDLTTQTSFTGNGIGSGILVTSSTPEKDTLQYGIGVDYLMDNNFSISANYDRNDKKNFKSDTYTAKLRYDF